MLMDSVFPFRTEPQTRTGPVKITGRYLVLDFHADTIVTAVAEEGRSAASGGEGQLLICYEAGPTGYVLYRKLQRAGFEVHLNAPSLIPQKSEGVKTDRAMPRRLRTFCGAAI